MTVERKQNGDTTEFIQAVGLRFVQKAFVEDSVVFRGTFYRKELRFNDCSIWNAVSI